MEMKFDIYRVKEEYKENFIPKKGRLSNFEQWAMIKAYCSLCKQFGAGFFERDIEETCVWDGNYLYNADRYQIAQESELIDLDDPNVLERNPFENKKVGKSRLWLTENNILMLEVYFDDDRPNKLYCCD